jgi:hypothetical protein
MVRKFHRYSWPICGIAFVGLIICHVRTSLIRLALIFLGFALWIRLLILVWRHVVVRNALIVVSNAVGLFLSFPVHRPIDARSLRRTYVNELQRYNQVHYVYGGENFYGIDCSGLVRAAMINSLFKDGVASLNPFMLRSAVSLWWHDANAVQLGKDTRGFTLPVGSGSPIPLQQSQRFVTWRPGNHYIGQSCARLSGGRAMDRGGPWSRTGSRRRVSHLSGCRRRGAHCPLAMVELAKKPSADPGLYPARSISFPIPALICFLVHNRASA